MRVDRQELPKYERRKAIAGIFAAILIFGLIFTAGLGYYIFESQTSLSASQAAVGEQAVALQAGQERLSLAIYRVSSGSHSNWLFVEAYNAGGVSVTITAVYITNSSSGRLLSISTASKSAYLVGQPDLNVSLPLTLNVGVNTTAMSGCAAGIGCSIGVNTTAFSYTHGTAIFVNVLTSRGNVFSIGYQYPPKSGSSTITSTSTFASYTTITSASTSIVTTASTTTLVTSSTLGVGFGIGTNSLVVTMEACPGTSSFGTTCVVAPTVYQGGEVILKVNVTNFASVAMLTYLNFQSVGTNGASVSNHAPNSCSGGTTSTQNIPANTGTPATATFTCTFSANTGPTGGAVTFIGYAVGRYTGPVGPVQITSAEATSNPLSLGNPTSGLTGPWVVNYFSFNYASSQHNAWAPADIVSSSANSKVIFQVQVTNTANASLTVLQYSYFQMLRTQQEMDYYLIQPVTTYTASIQAYNCIDNAGVPSGSNCNPVQTNCSVLGNGCVPIGSTTTLSFAACTPDSASFMWANTGGGNSACSGNTAGFNPPEGVVGFIVIVYGFYNAGKWNILSQTLPFQGLYVS